MLSAACVGEKCWCGESAAKKVGEEIMFDDPQPARHNLTAYVCAAHYAQLMGPAGAEQVAAIAAGAQSAETSETSAPSEGCQSGAENTAHRPKGGAQPPSQPTPPLHGDHND